MQTTRRACCILMQVGAAQHGSVAGSGVEAIRSGHGKPIVLAHEPYRRLAVVAIGIAESGAWRTHGRLDEPGTFDDLVRQCRRCQSVDKTRVVARVAADRKHPRALHAANLVPVQQVASSWCLRIRKRLVQTLVQPCISAERLCPRDEICGRQPVTTIPQPLPASVLHVDLTQRVEHPIGPETIGRPDQIGHHEQGGRDSHALEQRPGKLVVVAPAIVEGDRACPCGQRKSLIPPPDPVPQIDDSKVAIERLQVALQRPRLHHHARLLAVRARVVGGQDAVVGDDPQGGPAARDAVGAHGAGRGAQQGAHGLPDHVIGGQGVSLEWSIIVGYDRPARRNLMRVLHLIDTTGPGGAETVFVELADRMRGRGHDTFALLRGEGWVAAEMRRRDVPFSMLPRSGGFDVALLRHLVRTLRTEDIDVVQSHLLGSNLYAAMACLATGTPLIATFHGEVDVAPDERLRWLKFQLMRAGASRFVVVSDDLKQRLMTDHPQCARRTQVIHNGIDALRYANASPLPLHARLQLPAGAPVVGLVGNVRPAKAYDALLDIAAVVHERRPDVHFVVAGQGRDDLMAPLLRQRSALGLDQHVHFIGFVDDVPGFLKALDVFLLCSRSEGFSIATLEAMAAGTPVIASRSGGPEEIIEPDRTGTLVGVDDVGGFADAICARLAGVGNDTICQARREVERHFSLEAMIDAYDGLYRSVTGN